MSQENSAPLLVTKTFLPPLEEYVAHLKDIWDAGQVTNIGPKTRELESLVARYFGAKHALLVTNGALALQLALRALPRKGKVITTPFSYVATLNSVIWEGFEPVFADISEDSCCLDPEKVEELITEETVALLPVHVYGNACDTENLQRMASDSGISLIYDAAHTFGSTLNGTPLVRYGDVSILSFHATKLFHSVEGGAIITDNTELYDRLNWMHTFGHQGDQYFGLGLNGKMSEFHAAMGLCNLPRVSNFLEQRKSAHEHYDRLLFPSTNFRKPLQAAGLQHNYAYYPVIFENESQCLRVIEVLKKRQIFPRRYFFPALNTLPHVPYTACPVAESVSRRVLCLPLSATIGPDDIERTAAGVLEGSA